MPKCKKCGKKGLMLKLNAQSWCMDCVTEAYTSLESILTPELRELVDVRRSVNAEKEKLAMLQQKCDAAIAKREEAEKRLIDVSDEIEFQSFSLYRPRYEFAKSEDYKAKLDEIRAKQKAMIKDQKAAICSTSWTVHNSKSEGKKFTRETVKLFVRAFNDECDATVNSVRFSNFDRCRDRIDKSFDAINNLGKVSDVRLSSAYRDLKIDELHLAYEYQIKKQEEKEAAAVLRAQQREEAKVAKEIEAARKEAEKEKKHYLQALERLSAQIEAEPDNTDLLTRKSELLASLDDISAKLEDIDYRQSNQRAGYVYIISNVGSFGEGIYKIGMTRRLDPMERVYELGDASVPFQFDVHAMIFSNDAPKLEAALHQAFADKRVNMVNTRREYFRVGLDEIKKVVRENHDKTVEFTEIPEAQQYRESLLMAGSGQTGKNQPAR